METNLPDRRKAYALGETVLDLVSAGGFTMRAVPGGSMLNASVSLGRMGIETHLISELGADITGDRIIDFLKTCGVNTKYCIRHNHHKTSLALAFLDNAMKASYSFYHDSPESLEGEEIPVFRAGDILLFGSYYSVKPERRTFLQQVQKAAIEARCAIYYDLNIRKAQTHDNEIFMHAFLNNMAVASIVKGSDEDFYNLFGLTDSEKIYEKVKPFCKILIITNGANPLQVFTSTLSKTYSVPKIIPVSTIGAGDSFNAGFIYGIASSHVNSINFADMLVNEMDRLIGCGLAFATETCLSEENYIKANFESDFWKKYI